jgi:hypothetical protein
MNSFSMHHEIKLPACPGQKPIPTPKKVCDHSKVGERFDFRNARVRGGSLTAGTFKITNVGTASDGKTLDLKIKTDRYTQTPRINAFGRLEFPKVGMSSPHSYRPGKNVLATFTVLKDGSPYKTNFPLSFFDVDGGEQIGTTHPAFVGGTAGTHEKGKDTDGDGKFDTWGYHGEVPSDPARLSTQVQFMFEDTSEASVLMQPGPKRGRMETFSMHYEITLPPCPGTR